MKDLEAPQPTSPPKEVRFSKSAKNQSPGGIQTVDSADTTMTINHSFSNHTTGTSRSAGTLLGMSKPVAAVVGLALLGTTGAGIWGWLQIPGLNEQIEKLETQVDRLEGQVTRLEGEVDRLEGEVDRFEGENNRYEDLNGEFNTTLSELQLLNDELEDHVETLQQEVGQLSGEVDKLEKENNRYERINGDLNNTVLDLREVNDDLRSTVANLDDTVEDLNSTVSELEDVNKDLQEENKKFSNLNDQLKTILSYLNETSGNLDESYEQLAGHLAEQITANRILVLQGLKNTYTQQISFWDCSFRDVFRGEPFIDNEDLILGGSLPTVLEYVEDRVLSELCINTADFELYLASRYGLNLVSTNQLYQGVATYSTAVLEFFFPDSGEEGLSPEEWASAGYSCEGVRKYSFSR